MNNSFLALIATLLLGTNVLASPQVTCELSTHPDDEWESCAKIVLDTEIAGHEQGRGAGDCSDIKLLLLDLATKKPNEVNYTVIISRETKEVDNADSTWLSFGNVMPPQFYIQPNIPDGKNYAIRCTTQEMPAAK